MPHSKRTPATADTVLAVARHARLEITDQRAAELAPALDGILELLDSLDAVELGETAPAFAYKAKWEGSQ